MYEEKPKMIIHLDYEMLSHMINMEKENQDVAEIVFFEVEGVEVDKQNNRLLVTCNVFKPVIH